VEQEPSWQRQLLIGLSVLLAIGLLVGGIIAVIAVKAADYVGLGGTPGNSTSGPNPILPTTGDATHTAGPPTRTPASTTQTTTHPTAHQPRPAFSLVARPTAVASFGKINLTGRYPGHDGTTLQVQRSIGKGPWEDFPTTTAVSGGTFATYIQTSMVGVNHIRMLDKATGKTSSTVTVRVG
jgi:hypothetical protein